MRELTTRGLRVGTIKHTAHTYDTDSPGTDSQRHREAGAFPAAFVSGDNIGVHFPVREDGDFYAQLSPLYAACDWLLVEGDRERGQNRGNICTLEVWRAERGDACYASDDQTIRAIITDDDAPRSITDRGLPILPRGNLAAIVDFLVAIE